jgi:hypothetical protein
MNPRARDFIGAGLLFASLILIVALLVIANIPTHEA